MTLQLKAFRITVAQIPTAQLRKGITPAAAGLHGMGHRESRHVGSTRERCRLQLRRFEKGVGGTLIAAPQRANTTCWEHYVEQRSDRRRWAGHTDCSGPTPRRLENEARNTLATGDASQRAHSQSFRRAVSIA